MPNASHRRPQFPADVIPGEATFIVWRVEEYGIEGGQALANNIRSRGGVVVGCSLDVQVKRDRNCPVCGARGKA